MEQFNIEKGEVDYGIDIKIITSSQKEMVKRTWKSKNKGKILYSIYDKMIISKKVIDKPEQMF